MCGVTSTEFVIYCTEGPHLDHIVMGDGIHSLDDSVGGLVRAGCQSLSTDLLQQDVRALN